MAARRIIMASRPFLRFRASLVVGLWRGGVGDFLGGARGPSRAAKLCMQSAKPRLRRETHGEAEA